MKFFPAILIALLFISCRPCKEFSSTIIENDTLIIYRDSLIVIPADSALISAYFKCDSNNHVVMAELEELKGRKVVPVIHFKDNWLTVVAKVDSEAVYLRWKEQHTSTDKQETFVETKRIYPKWLVTIAILGLVVLVINLSIIVLKAKRILL